MTKKFKGSDNLVRQLKDMKVLTVVADDSHRLVIQFAEGASLTVGWRPDGLNVHVTDLSTKDEPHTSPRPTKRQLEYLVFIRKYITRYGRPPAESDIEQHFLVSAPSVNQMMQMLERRGFITRQAGVPRSTRICFDLDALT